MFATTAFSLSATTRAAVLALLKAKGDARSLEAVVDEALHAWLQKTTCEDPQAAHAAARGYQWKSLFLPEGTLLRFDYRWETYEAQVRGNKIIYQGRAYSPRQLLLHITGTVRNAWRELWLRSPGDARWHLADTRRRILRRVPREAQAIRIPRSCTVLHRDDIVRDDQPDLACKLGGGGQAKAGRCGARDRRACNNIFALLRPPT
jgi:hypothetical protein